MNVTPASERQRIVLTGRCNVGKSSLMNALCGSDTALVASLPGTTTDAVTKGVELPGAGACTLVDTAGLDDTTPLGDARRSRTQREIERADIVVAVYRPDDPSPELPAATCPVICVMNCADLPDADAAELERKLGREVVAVSALTGEGIGQLRAVIARAAESSQPLITGDLVNPGNTVVLVMPQDPQAPKGRLILPQSATIRELVGRGVITVCTDVEHLRDTLDGLRAAPALTITDSQVFGAVAAILPATARLTSFSVLMAGYKGDIRLFMEGAKALDRLTENSRVLIAEACAHAPATEDIGRVKIPRMLRKRVGEGLRIDFASGQDFPEDLGGYDLVVHCGGCMFTRRHVLSRCRRAAEQSVPVTNYGILIAHATGILDRITVPSSLGEGEAQV